MFRLRTAHGSKLAFRRVVTHQRGRTSVEPVGLDAVYGNILEEVGSASAELSRFKTVPEVAEAALGIALDLTRSAVAYLAVVEEDGEDKRVFSRAADAVEGLRPEEIERIFSVPQGPEMPTRAFRFTRTQPLEAAGRTLGMFAVASPTGYTATQQRAFALFAGQAASSIALAQLQERRQEMVDALVNLRADLDRSERQRLLNQERARSAERVEHAHEAAVDALLAVSRHARSGHGIADFFRRLHPTPCAPDRDDLASRVVFHDLMFRAGREDESSDFQYVLDVLGVKDAIEVPWRAGDERLGLVAAYNSRREDGFSREDAWVLQKAGLAAGLVWQLKYAETDLKKTVDRLQKVDETRGKACLL